MEVTEATMTEVPWAERALDPCARHRASSRVSATTSDTNPDSGAETRLIQRTLAGDLEAYEALLRNFNALAYRTAYLITRDSSDAEEAVQDAFLKAFRALHRFRPGAPFRPWLLAIVANEAKSRRRRHIRQINLTSRIIQYAESGGSVRGVDEMLTVGSERAELLRAVDSLSEKHRNVVTCRYLLELSEEETADVLALPAGTVKSRLSRALAKLEELLVSPLELNNG